MMRPELLSSVLENHLLWLSDGYKGKRADLRWTNLEGANLSGINLRWADLSETFLRRANLRDANLSKANLRWAYLDGANLSGTDMRGVDLSWTVLLGVNLNGADLTDTVLDPKAKPNGDVAGFERDGDLVVGYRTARSPILNGLGYEPGRTYEAPWFSVCKTECHPGLYLAPSVEYLDKSGPYVKVWARPEDVHHAGSKWRAKRFVRVEGVR